MAGIVVSASDAKEVVKELEGEKIESQVADLTIMDASNYSVDVTLCGGLASDVSAVVVVVGLTDVQIRVAEDKITGVWSTECSEFQVLKLNIEVPAEAKNAVRLVQPRALGNNVSKETLPLVTCGQAHWLMDNKMESTELLEVQGLQLSSVNDPLETAMCERRGKKSDDKEEVLKVSMVTNISC